MRYKIVIEERGDPCESVSARIPEAMLVMKVLTFLIPPAILSIMLAPLWDMGFPALFAVPMIIFLMSWYVVIVRVKLVRRPETRGE
jgi:hypothetical protein